MLSLQDLDSNCSNGLLLGVRRSADDNLSDTTSLRYVLDLCPLLEPAIIDDLLTSLEQFAQPAEARKWLLTVTASSENTDLLWENEGIDCGNLYVKLSRKR